MWVDVLTCNEKSERDVDAKAITLFRSVWLFDYADMRFWIKLTAISKYSQTTQCIISALSTQHDIPKHSQTMQCIITARSTQHDTGCFFCDASRQDYWYHGCSVWVMITSGPVCPLRFPFRRSRSKIAHKSCLCLCQRCSCIRP
jgi:hypothetical protein